jgi:hypothetical protein
MAAPAVQAAVPPPPPPGPPPALAAPPALPAPAAPALPGPPAPIAQPHPPAPDNLPMPAPFWGANYERGRDWLQSFQLWAAYRGQQDPAKAAALPLLLREAALRWYNTLPAATRNNWPLLEQAFTLRYGLDPRAEWQRVSLVWATHQGPQEIQESVQDNVARVLQTSDDAGIPQDNPGLQINTRKNAVISGLRPSVRHEHI